MPAEAVLRSLRHVWMTLEPLGLPMAVMGGLALAAWRHMRATRDVDLLIGIGATALEDVLATLRAAGLRTRRQPPLTSLGHVDVVQMLYEPPETFLDLSIDLLVGRSEYHREALRRRVPVRLPEMDIDVAVLACEDMILQKLQAGRAIDQADAVALVRANHASLDCGYLTSWARQLGIAADLARVWAEALPDA
jgi:hypothetical protein